MLFLYLEKEIKAAEFGQNLPESSRIFQNLPCNSGKCPELNIFPGNPGECPGVPIIIDN
jgi:hypothetical protein